MFWSTTPAWRPSVPLKSFQDAELRLLMDTMYFGPVAMIARPYCRACDCGRAGTIVQMSSMGGQVSMPGFGAYCSAKFALEALSEALAAEVAPYGIRVLIVEPGAFAIQLRGPSLPGLTTTTGITRRPSVHSAPRS